VILDQYKIDGISDDLKGYSPTDAARFENPDYRPEFQRELGDFQVLLKDLAARKKNKTLIRLGDGDYYFLKGTPYGSAAPGKRALSVPYSLVDSSRYAKNLVKNDYFGFGIFAEGFSYEIFEKDFPELKFNFPLEFLYGLLASKWLLNFPGSKIGLIGGAGKMRLTRELLERAEYQDFLGIDNFTDYIEIPEKFACDDLDKLETHVKTQLEKSEADVFLFGMGHVKLGLASRLKDFKEALYIDIGTGIDALAGIQEYERPYFSHWQNYKLKNFDYSRLDMMQSSLNGKEIWLD
jgi:hypothetical protein